jgi:hypothetical protein
MKRTIRGPWRVTPFLLLVLALASVSPALVAAPPNRVFASARSGSDSNPCDSIGAPCLTLAAAVTKVNPSGGEVIVLDSGGYGPVTITTSVTIEAAAGITAFIHPPSGDAVTINATGQNVTLRGLVLSGGTNDGIKVVSVGTLNIENCFITGFANNGLELVAAAQLTMKDTDVTGCGRGVFVFNPSGAVTASIDRCHFDGNQDGLVITTLSPGTCTLTAVRSSANNNAEDGWKSTSTGVVLVSLESCSGSQNTRYGLNGSNFDAGSATRFSNCVFTNNHSYGINSAFSGVVESRGNNTVTGNSSGPTFGTVGSFSGL